MAIEKLGLGTPILLGRDPQETDQQLRDAIEHLRLEFTQKINEIIDVIGEEDAT